jgi:2-phospho-L-lactate guanylyltransferase
VRTAAVLPVKRFAHAKQRLGAHVDDELRLQLARAMVSDVLAVVTRASSVDATIVVTGEPAVAAEARAQGAIVLADSAGSGQSAAVAIGIAYALTGDFERVLCLPGDCPTLEPDDLERLLAGADGDRTRSGAITSEVVIVPDRHGTGTNGLLLTPPDVIAPSFGPGSCARHRERARQAGVTCRLDHPRSLLLDVDTGEDLAVLRERLAGAGAPAPRTRALLEAFDRRPSLITSSSD